MFGSREPLNWHRHIVRLPQITCTRKRKSRSCMWFPNDFSLLLKKMMVTSLFAYAVLFTLSVASSSYGDRFARRSGCPLGRFCPINADCTSNATSCVVQCPTERHLMQQGNHTTGNCERSTCMPNSLLVVISLLYVLCRHKLATVKKIKLASYIASSICIIELSSICVSMYKQTNTYT